MISLFSLINKHFWKSVTGPTFCFVLPTLLLFFCGLILGYTFVMPGGLVFPILTIGLVFIPQSIFEFKNSSLLKRISLTNINTKNFFLVFFIYNFLIIIASIIFQLLFSLLIFYENLYVPDEKASFFGPNANLVEGMSYLQVLETVRWGDFIYSLILMITLTIMIGFMIASIARSGLFIISTGISVILITMFLSPTILPIQMLSNVEVIKYIGYIWPLKYTMGTLIESFNGNLPNGAEAYNNITGSIIWDINHEYVIFDSFKYIPNPQNPNLNRTIIYFNKLDKIFNLIIPYIFSICFLWITFKKFSWSTRGSKKINFKNALNFNKNTSFEKQTYIRGDINSPYIIEAKNISKTFKGRKDSIIANDDINIKFKKNQNVAILGENGSGKTTFIEMLLGINKPDDGYFKYNYDYKKNFNQYLGVQFQDSTYPYGLKCRDIIIFFKDIFNLNITDKELNELIEKFGIKKFYNKNASSLSGGQQQRLNLFLSILHKPKIIFLDELSTGLDIKIRNKIKSFIKKYSKENGISLVVISHDMNEVDYLCDRIIILKNGKIIEDKLKKEILKNNKDIESFIVKYLDK